MNTPGCLRHARPKTRAVFWHLLRTADSDGLVQLHANQIAGVLGISRRTVYYAVKFLAKCQLVAVEQSLLGRGHHSVLKLRWKCHQSLKKPESVQSPIPPIKKKNLNALTGDTAYRYAMMHFRKLLGQSLLYSSELKRCMQYLGKALKGKDKASKDRLWNYLAPLVPTLSTPDWCWADSRKVYAWFGSLVRKATGA